MTDPKLVVFILDVTTRFHRLVHVVINIASLYRLKLLTKIVFLQLFAATFRVDGSMIDVCFRRFDEINFWP